MSVLSRILTLLFDLLAAPFGSHRLASLVVLSLLCGAGLALVYRATSNQDRIRRTRDVFKARVLEMRLYPDDLVLITKALFGALASQAAYLRVALVPILVVLAIAVPLFFQVESRFARAHLEPGERTLVTATLKEGLDPGKADAVLRGDGACAVDPRPVRVSATREIVWRVDVVTDEDASLTVEIHGHSYTFPLSTSRGTDVIGRTRSARSVADAVVHPGLPHIPSGSPLAAIRVAYPDDHYRLLGVRTGWLMVFLAGSLAGAIIPAWLLRIQL